MDLGTPIQVKYYSSAPYVLAKHHRGERSWSWRSWGFSYRCGFVFGSEARQLCRAPARPQRCEQHRGLVSSPERWLSTFKGFGVVGDTGIEPVTSCVSCKRANQLRQSP